MFTYLDDTPPKPAPIPEKQHHERRQRETAAQTRPPETPGAFALVGAAVDADHQEDNVEGGCNVEDF